MNYITLNGVSSNTITGLLIQELPPISLPKMRTEINEIDGRDGDIVTELGYSAYDKEISIGLHGSFDINQVIAFFASRGTVIFSNEPDKYYRYQVIEQIDFERLVRFRTATVKMHVQPFKYDAEETEIDEDGGEVLTGDIVSFNSVSTDPLADVKVAVTPVQDLHGYANPWVGGGGANQWDEEWEVGSINSSTGQNNVDSNEIRSKNYIPIMPLTQYYCYVGGGETQSNMKARFYDADKNYLGSSPDGATFVYYNRAFTTPSTAYYMRFAMQPSYGTTYNNNVAINYPSTVTTYSPYSNICPITGWTGANVVRTGKNLNPSTGVNYTTSNATRIFCKAGTYTISTNNGASLGSNNQLYIRLFDAQTDGNTITSGNITGSNMQLNSSGTLLYGGNGYASVTVTIAVDCWVALGFNNQVPSNFTGLQMEVGSSATSYEAYSGNTYSIPFGQTVYGGTLDVTTGVLTVDRAIMTPTIDQFTSANSHGITNSRFVISPSCDYATRNTSICNALPIQNTLFADTATEGFLMSGQDVGYIRLLSSRVSTKQEAQDFVNTNGITIVYPLATPTTIQLTPTEVKSLLGSNNIFADCGDSEVTVPNLITVTNKGNTIARPRMTIYGSGNVNVIVNGIQVFSIAMGDIGYITIDGEQMEATQGEGVLKNRLVTGDYSDFVLQSGENIIALTGNVTEVQISNYSRWL